MNKESPNGENGGLLAQMLGKMSAKIASESGASAVMIKVAFSYVSREHRGHLTVDVSVSPDATKERIRDGSLQPKGDCLQNRVGESVLEVFNRLMEGDGTQKCP